MENANQETFPLDDAVIATLGEIRDSVKATQQGAVMATQAVIACFARQHGIQGQITIADNQRELIIRRARAPQEVDQ